jgi:hypothetical protein
MKIIFIFVILTIYRHLGYIEIASKLFDHLRLIHRHWISGSLMWVNPVCQATPKHFEHCLHFGDSDVILCQNRERRLFWIVHGAVLKHNNEKCKPILLVLLLGNQVTSLCMSASLRKENEALLLLLLLSSSIPLYTTNKLQPLYKFIYGPFAKSVNVACAVWLRIHPRKLWQFTTSDP